MTRTRKQRKPTWNGGEGLGSVVLDRDGSGLSWLSRLSLQVDVFTLCFCLLLKSSVGLDSVKELFSALGVSDVLDSDVDSLLHVSAVDDLVDDDSDTSWRDVVDDTGLSVVDWGQFGGGWLMVLHTFVGL